MDLGYLGVPHAKGDRRIQKGGVCCRGLSWRIFGNRQGFRRKEGGQGDHGLVYYRAIGRSDCLYPGP